MRKIAVMLLAGLITFFAATPAQAATPGSTRAIINNVSGTATFTIHANATGWSRGTINVSYEVYASESSGGPWTYLTDDSNQCLNTTSCSTATTSGTCSGAWYKVVAHASGPGGKAENDGDTAIRYISGTISAIVSLDAASIAIPTQCKRLYKKI